MTKRSSGKFERRGLEFYATPRAAVAPLVPLLIAAGVRSFAEPCVGNGDLAAHLESFGFTCVWASELASADELAQRRLALKLGPCPYGGEIMTGVDALGVTQFNGADAAVTNPPWDKSRQQMQALVRHFSAIAPTWLLMPQDWYGTKRSIPYIAACTDVLPIGRVIWIAGTRNGGYDNAAWYRFEPGHTRGPFLHAYRAAPVQLTEQACSVCGRRYRSRRADALVCSNACRQRAYRARLKCNAAVTREPEP